MISYLMILLAASLWGGIAFFVKGLAEMGFSAMEIVTIRVVWAAFFLLILGMIKYRKIIALKRPSDIRYFIGTGIISIVLFNWCYFKAINEMNISLAVILLYTSPAFVAILSYLFLKEKMTIKKIVAVAGTFIGCVLIAGMSGGSIENITMTGVMIGLGSGLFFALYSIFGKFALVKYQPFTVTFYTFVVAAIFLIPVTQLWTKWDMLFSAKVLLYGTGFGLLPTIVAFILYNAGLQKIESSKAAILATIEPLVATLLGIMVYQEKITLFQFIGSIIILVSVIMVQIPNKQQQKKQVKTF